MTTPATNDHYPQILALTRHFATSFEVNEAAFGEAFEQLLFSPNTCFLVASENEQVVGYVLGFDHWTLYANGKVAWVEEIMVAETHRRKGVGGELMSAFEVWASSRGAKVTALATRRARAFYLALDYEESATYFRKVIS